MTSLTTRIGLCLVTSAVCFGTGAWLSAQDEPKEGAENVDQAKVKIAVLLAKSQIVQSLNEKGASAVNATKLSTKGRTLIDRKYDLVIRELQQKPGLEKWVPSEAEQLIAMRNAAAEFLEALVEARDNVRKKVEKDTTKKKSAGSGASPLGPSVSLGTFNALQGPAALPLSDLGKWRGDVLKQGNLFYDNLKDTNNDEKDLRLAWKTIKDKVIEVFDRIQPALISDQRVKDFQDEGLIRSWDRGECKEEVAIILPSTKKVIAVSYKIVDAYGTPRRGKVLLALEPREEGWLWAKENDQRGGFYELSKE